MNDFRIFDRWIRPDLNRVVIGDRTLAVEPRVMQVLVRLAETPGAVVSRDELHRSVWNGTTVTEDVLTRCISELRKLFDDDPRHPRVVETIHGKGYRLIAQPEALSDGAPSAATRSASLRLSLAALGLVLGGAAAGVFLVRPPGAPDRPGSTRTFPLTTDPGSEFSPAMSPDGQRVAYAAPGENGGDDLFVRLVNSDEPLRLTRDPRPDRHPAWSLDGTRIAFVRETDSTCEVFLVPALGGPERPLTTCSPHHHGLAWSPDARFLALPVRQGTGPWRIRLVAVDGSGTRDVTGPADSFAGDHTPSFSPDGKTLAFVRSFGPGSADIYLQPVDTPGELRRLTFDHRGIAGLDWWFDGGSLVYSSNRSGTYSLWRVALAGGEPTWIAGGGQKLKNPSVARRVPALAYEAWSYDKNVWMAAIEGDVVDSGPLVTSTEWDEQPALTEDGSRAAFVSTRSGSPEIWVAGTDGSAPFRVTSLGGPELSLPRWSPGGDRIVFVARPRGEADLYVADVSGSPARALTSDPGDELAPSFSRDGRFVYFASRRSGAWEIWKIPATGGPAEPVTENGGSFARESPDGRFLYFTKRDAPGLFRRAVGGGDEELVLGSRQIDGSEDWDVTDRGVYFVSEVPDQGFRVLRQDLSSDAPVVVAALGGEFTGPGLSVSADGRRIVYTRVDREEADVMVIENPP